MMLLLFVLAVVFCLYTYLIFPVVLHWRAGRKAVNPIHSTGEPERREWPQVSIIIAAHNEASRLPRKLASLRALDYPAERLEIVIVSDGSTDETGQLLSKEAGLVFRHYEPARGKPTALNLGIQVATGNFLVFMDARQQIEQGAIKALVSRFDDPTVGVVSGELVMSDDGETEAANVGLYWRYEKWIRQNESQLYSTTGATGALYCIRAEDAIELPAEILLDDFEIPVSVLKRGRRTVFEPAAKVFDQAEKSADREFARKARTLAGNYQSFVRNGWLFSPVHNPVWWQFLSHKVFRLLVPVALVIAFLTSLLGEGRFLNLMLLAQLLFYGIGLAAFYSPALARFRLTNLIKVFLQLNAAAVVGAWRYFSGSASVRWRTTA